MGLAGKSLRNVAKFAFTILFSFLSYRGKRRGNVFMIPILCLFCMLLAFPEQSFVHHQQKIQISNHISSSQLALKGVWTEPSRTGYTAL